MDVKEKVEITALKDDFSKRAQDLILEEFPKKIIELNNLLETDLFTMTDLRKLHVKIDVPSSSLVNGQPEQPPSKKRKRISEDDSIEIKDAKAHAASISTNPMVVEVINHVKPEIVRIIDRCNQLKIWVQLMIPKIEDGNNFGVGIQEDVLSEVSKAEQDAGSYLEQISRYYTCRAKMISKVAKYPDLADYRRGIDEYDEKVYISFKLVLQEIRNIYIVLYDIIIKNFEKLIRPRNSNTSSLY